MRGVRLGHEGVDGRDVDDPSPPLPGHDPGGRLAAEERPSQIHGQRSLPDVQRDVEKCGREAHPGVVDQDVQAPEAAEGLLDQRSVDREKPFTPRLGADERCRLPPRPPGRAKKRARQPQPPRDRARQDHRFERVPQDDGDDESAQQRGNESHDSIVAPRAPRCRSR